MVMCWLSASVGLVACSGGPDTTETATVDGGTRSGDPAVGDVSTTPDTEAFEVEAGGDGGDVVVSTEWIYLTNEEEGNHALFAVRSDGSDQWKLTSIDAYSLVSPEGSRIAFLVSGSDGGAELFVMDVDGTNQKKLADLDDDVGPAWSPDGTRLAFSDYREDQYGDGDYEIFVVAADGSAGPQQVTRNSTIDDLILPGFGSWSPDSSRIAFSRDFGPATTDSMPDNFTKVFVMDADGSNERQLVSTDDCQDWAPTWSPDGTRIAYFSHCDGTHAISVIDSDGSNPHEAVPGDEGTASWPPVWSPDGTRLAFYGRRDDAYTVSIVNADGSGSQQPNHNRSTAATGEVRRLSSRYERKNPDSPPSPHRASWFGCKDHFDAGALGKVTDMGSGSGCRRPGGGWQRIRRSAGALLAATAALGSLLAVSAPAAAGQAIEPAATANQP